jgi:hypothetical protein
MEGELLLRFCQRNGTRLIALTVVALVWCSRAGASPTYSLTDLGSGTGQGSIVYSSDASGNGIVIAYGMTAYPFPQTAATTLLPTQIGSSGLPVFDAAPAVPSGQSGSVFSYSSVQTAMQNVNGTVAATDAAGTYGAVNQVDSQSAYFVQKNADGSWSAPVLMWSGSPTPQYVPYYGSLGNSIWGINKQNEVIGIMQTGTGASATDSGVVYDINTKTLTSLSTLPNVLAAGFLSVTPFAIDNAGRILATAVQAGGGEDMILLTPAGVNSYPLPVPAPEPSTLAVMLLGSGVFAARRYLSRPARIHPG